MSRQQQPSMQHLVVDHSAVVRAWLLLSILGVWCIYLGGHGGVAAFVVPGLQQQQQQQQRLLGRRSCLPRGGPQSVERRGARCLTMDAEGAGGEGVAVPIPKTYSRNGRWTVYSAGRGNPSTKRDPDRVLSKKAQAKREKEHELGTKIQRMVKLQKVKDGLMPASGEEGVSNEAWAEATGETVESLREALEEGASAKQEMVLSNLSLVDIIVNNYVRTFAYGRFTETDLKQDATVGLIRAVEKFDPERGFLFSTYGRWWVRKYLHEGVQNHDRMVRIPNNAAYRIAKVKRIRGELEVELGREPTKPELALEAGLSVQQVEACLEQDAFYIERLDKYMGHGFGIADNLFAAHFGDQWVYGVDMLGPHPGESLEPTLDGAKVLQVSLREDLSSAFVRLLDATERECLVLRYGLHDGVTNSIEETAEIMDFCDPDDVRIITTQAMAKLRDGCLPEERKKLMSYLSVYQPKSTDYSKTKYNPARNKANRDSSSTHSSIRSSIDSIGGSSSTSGSGPDESATNGDEMTDVDDAGRISWMEDGARAEVSAVSASRNSKGEERRGVWEATTESQELISAKQERRGAQEGQGVGGAESQDRQAWDAKFSSDTANNDQQQQQKGRNLKVKSDSDTGASGRGRGEERQLWDFSKHGQEELQQELTRYLRRHRRIKKNAAKAAALAAENAKAAEEKAAAAAAGAEVAEHDEEGGDEIATGSTARRKKSVIPRRRVSSSTRLGRYSRSAVDLARQQREERQLREEQHLELEERAREEDDEEEEDEDEEDEEEDEEEEEWRSEEDEEEGRTIPVGNGAGSAVVGDLEPVPNSREADQLEHLSRLLWDGQEEPDDFALSYGKPAKGRSLQ